MMLNLRLTVALGSAVAAAVWGWFSGLSVWAVLGLYILGGNLGLMGSAAVRLVRLTDGGKLETAPKDRQEPAQTTA
jgi:hypothetical protein